MKNILPFVTVSSLMLAVVSCVQDPAYDIKDIKDIDSEMTLFSEGLELPICRTTGQYTLDSLLKMSNDESVKKIFTADASGDYSINFSGNFNLNDQIASLKLKDAALLDGVNINNDLNFKFGDFKNNMTVAAVDVSVDTTIKSVEIPQFKISGLEDQEYSQVLYTPMETCVYNSIEMSLVDAVKLMADIFSKGNDDDLDVQAQLSSTGLDAVSLSKEDIQVRTFSFTFDLKDIPGLEKINSVQFDGGIGVNLKLVNPLFTSGTLVPDVKFDIGDGVTMGDGGYSIDFSEMVMSDSNGWTVSKTFPVKSIQGEYLSYDTVNKKVTLTLKITGNDGVFKISNAKTSVNKLEALKNSEMTAELSLSLNGLSIKDADFNIKAQEIEDLMKVEKTKTFSLELDGIDDLGTFTAVPSAPVAIDLGVKLPEITGLALLGDGLAVHISDMIELESVEGLPSGSYYDPSARNIVFNGPIPENMILHLKNLHITPVKEGGATIAKGDISAKGKLKLDKYQGITLTNFKEISKAKFSVSCKVPAFGIGTIKLEGDVLKDVSEKVDNIVLMDVKTLQSLPKELLSISGVDFKDASIDITLTPGSVPSLGSNSVILRKASIELPELLVLEGGGHVIELAETALKSNTPVKLSAKLSGLGAIDLSDRTKDLTSSVVFKGELFCHEPDIDLKTLNSDLAVSLLTKVGNAQGKFEVERIRGKVDYSLDENLKMELGEIPQELKQAEFAFNPTVKLDVRTNLGLPVKGNVEIVPYPYTDRTVKLENVELPSSSSAKTNVQNTIIIGRDVQESEGVTAYPVDLSALMRNIPDYITVKVTAAVDKEQDCVVEPSADYTFLTDYVLNIPLKSENDASVNFASTDIELGGDVAKYLKMGTVGFKADAISTLPLGVTVQLQLLDESGKVIGLSPEFCPDGKCEMQIEPYRGGEQMQSINTLFSVKGTDAVPSKLRLSYHVDIAKDINLNKSQYLQLKNVIIVIPQGITMDPANMK